MKSRNSYLLLSLIALAFSCSNATVEEETVEVDTTGVIDSANLQESGIEVGGTVMVKSKNLMENALGSSIHTTFVSAISSADLDSMMMSSGPFTVFAPTDSAFSTSSVKPGENMQGQELGSFLKYHIIPGNVYAADFTEGRKMITLNGQELTVSIRNGEVYINESKITIGNIENKNGLMHVVDKVLMPITAKKPKA